MQLTTQAGITTRTPFPRRTPRFIKLTKARYAISRLCLKHTAMTFHLISAFDENGLTQKNYCKKVLIWASENFSMFKCELLNQKLIYHIQLSLLYHAANVQNMLTGNMLLTIIFR